MSSYPVPLILCVSICAGVHVCAWRSKGNLGCCSLGAVYLFFSFSFFLVFFSFFFNLSSRLSCLVSKSQESSHLCLTMLGSQAQATIMPAIYIGSGGQMQILTVLQALY